MGVRVDIGYARKFVMDCRLLDCVLSDDFVRKWIK